MLVYILERRYMMLRLVPPSYMPARSVIDYWREVESEDPNKRPTLVTNSLLFDEAEYISLSARNNEEEKLFFYFIKDLRSKYIIGHCTITKSVAESKNGKIKIAIRPNEENKGWENYLLGLAFNMCNDLGLEDIILLCFDYYEKNFEECFQRAGATFKGFCNDEHLEPCLGSLCEVRYIINLRNRTNTDFDNLNESVIARLLRPFNKRNH